MGSVLEPTMPVRRQLRMFGRRWLPMNGKALAGCLVVAFVLAGCGSGGRDDDVTAGGPTGGELPDGSLVAGDGLGWLIEDRPRPEGEVINDPAPHRVYRIGSTGRTEALPELEPMGIFDTRASGDLLIVTGARCSDGTLQENCAATAEVAVLDPGAKDWRTIEIAHGDNLEDLQFVILTSDDDRTRLLTDYDEVGRKDGAMHVAELDSSVTGVESWSSGAPINSGGFCALEGVVYSFTTSGGFMTPVQPGVQPDVLEPVPVSYQIYAYQDRSWQPAANGAWSGRRARAESMTCTDQGYVARVSDSSTGFLRWTPSRGWAETSAPPTAERVSLSLLDGHMVGVRDGQIVVERTPGEPRPIAGVPVSGATASGPPLLPPLAISQTTVVTCEPVIEGNPRDGSSTTALRNCTVVDRP